MLLTSHGDSRRPQWLPPGFRAATPKRNVLVAICYLLALTVGLELLRSLAVG